MTSRWKWQIGRVHRKSSWVSREISRFSHAPNTVVADIQTEQGRHIGRRARSDQVAACLLHRQLPASKQAPQRNQISRNRKRVLLAAAATLAWWIFGRLM